MWTRGQSKQGAWPRPCGWRLQSPGAQGSVLLESAQVPLCTTADPLPAPSPARWRTLQPHHLETQVGGFPGGKRHRCLSKPRGGPYVCVHTCTRAPHTHAGTAPPPLRPGVAQPGPPHFCHVWSKIISPRTAVTEPGPVRWRHPWALLGDVN